MAQKEMINMGSRIKLLRTTAKIKQKDLASKLNIKIASVSAYEKGKSEPPLSIVLQLADIFGVTTDYLLKGDQGLLENVTEEETGISSDIVRWLIAINKVNPDITESLNLLLESKAFKNAIDELNTARILEVGLSPADKQIDTLVSGLNEIQKQAGLDLRELQVTMKDKEDLHLFRSIKHFEKAVHDIVKEVWNNGTR